MKRRFKHFDFRRSTLKIIESANAIIAQYAGQGFDLTLRQLYYQFVARDLLANTERNYKRLGSIINDGRLAGLIDWNAISDRTRYLRGHNYSLNPGDFIRRSVDRFHLDKWAVQEGRVEVWIEKDALIGVLDSVCPELDVDYFSCRGYTSQSEMFRAGLRLAHHIANGQQVTVLHLGDHDPSGMDMSRDIEDRLAMFMGSRFESFTFKRIALTMDQIEEVGAPPNPAKVTDARFEAYTAEYGHESWELDALEPTYIANLITEEVKELRNERAWKRELAREEEMKDEMLDFASRWEDEHDE